VKETEDMIRMIAMPVVQQFMASHEQEDWGKMSLKYGNKVSFDVASLSRQMDLREKAKNKIKEFVTPQTLLLPKLFEQCTHELVAKYKSTLITGDKLLDATTGLGIDIFFIGRNAKDITCLEANPEHVLLLKHNLGQHHLNYNIQHTTLEFFLEQNSLHYDVIYVDPDRRPEAQQRVFDPEQCTPNVVSLKNQLLDKANRVWIKLSPMMDLQAIIHHFSPNIKHIYSIALQNEMKELLICLSSGIHEPEFTAINIGKEKTQEYTSKHMNVKPPLSMVLNYFFEPNVALIKSRLCMPYAFEHGLNILYPQGYYFTSDHPIKDLQGRLFKVIHAMPYKKEQLQQFIKTHSINKANISCRNFFWKPEEVKKELKLNDGGEWYLFCYTQSEKKSFAVWCKKTT